MAKRIKILFTIPNFDTAGSGRVVYDLVKGLDKTVFAPEICCFHKRGEFFKTVEALGVPIHEFTFAQSYRPFWSLPFRILKIARFFKKHQFDLIHSWHWSSDITEPLAARLAGIPFVYTKKAMGWGNRAWRWRSHLSTKVVAINKDMVNTFLNRFRDKVVYMPLGVDLDYFKPQRPSTTLGNKLGINPSEFVIVSVANLVPVKGIEVLLEAVNLLNDATLRVLIIGNDQNDYGFELKKKYPSDKIHFLGKQLDVRPYLALADLFVIPTLPDGRQEGLPIAPLEAMAMGIAVLGSDVAGVRDILAEFANFLFAPGNSHILSERIKACQKMDQEERRSWGLDMHNMVTSKYALDRCIHKHDILYKSLVKCI
ncbi:glycosyltransferase [Aestuariivivens sediminicola]|uniref:glycosyltransferase n=1 Tax=Aestuariivivens sediminicola TaxID=2913560 RepID=UPI001F583914|nr:glycosyltransferase [Aestuariivivens sediminicola]